MTSSRLLTALIGLVLLGLPACETGGDPHDAGGGDADVVSGDFDQDTISDADELRADRLDTDGDGVEDWQDPDSDGDGLLDIFEAGDARLDTPPIDSDLDGAPDYRDTDSDNNGYSDGVEGIGDFDLDGIPDYRDLDDDNDLARDREELAGVLDPPIDTDGDGRPNYRDPDSDNDLIMDGDEFGGDTDGDGLFDQEDLDSDGDGWTDEQEAGDTDVFSPPIDSDGDDIPDFRDLDSDNDGLSDAGELALGSDPRLADSDGDGVTDLIELAAGTDPNDPTVSPRTRGDFVFVVDYEEPATPSRDTLEFRTSIQFADIYFMFDASGSMSSSIDALRGAVGSVMADLTCTDFGTTCRTDSECAVGQVCSLSGNCIEDPSMSNCLASPWTGAAYYETEYRNLLSLQPDPGMTSAALSFSTFGGTEQFHRAVWGVANPMAAPGAEEMCASPMMGRVGCPAFREEAVKILVAFTDEDSDGSETAMQAADALDAAGITFIGVWAGSAGSSSRQDLVDIATLTNSVDRTGAPLVFDGTGAGVVPVVTSAINEIVEGVPLRVTIEASDEAGDAGDALQFIDYLEVNTSGGACSAVSPVQDTDGDGRPDAFPSLLPGTPVCWDVVPRDNTTVMPTPEPQVFRARLTVSGDGSPLDARTVYFLVPPEIPELCRIDC
ncbi:MAG: hypothetical protein RID81_01275 [Sandaracinaceae bacterium]